MAEDQTMQLFGKLISKWWLLMLLPLAIVILPMLLMSFFAANDLAGAILGPPAIWNRPLHTPLHLDLVGRYEETARHADYDVKSKAVLQLNADNSMIVTGLPDESGQSSCVMSGKGIWRGPDQSDQIDLLYESDGSPGTCATANYRSLEVTGHSKPYALYWVLGDPDSGTGVWLKRKS